MHTYEFEIPFSYSQIFVLDPVASAVLLDWSEEEVLQWFASKEQIVSFATILEFGFARVRVFFSKYPEDGTDHQRVITAPLRVSTGSIEIGGVEEPHSRRRIKLPSGKYTITCAQSDCGDERENIDLYIEPLPRAPIPIGIELDSISAFHGEKAEIQAPPPDAFLTPFEVAQNPEGVREPSPGSPSEAKATRGGGGASLNPARGSTKGAGSRADFDCGALSNPFGVEDKSLGSTCLKDSARKDGEIMPELTDRQKNSAESRSSRFREWEALGITSRNAGKVFGSVFLFGTSIAFVALEWSPIPFAEIAKIYGGFAFAIALLYLEASDRFSPLKPWQGVMIAIIIIFMVVGFPILLYYIL